jgi:hypothetical protein
MNDAKGYFDRIVHTVAILVLLSFGVLYNAARILFLVLAKARHKLKQGTGHRTGYTETRIYLYQGADRETD